MDYEYSRPITWFPATADNARSAWHSRGCGPAAVTWIAGMVAGCFIAPQMNDVATKLELGWAGIFGMYFLWTIIIPVILAIGVYKIAGSGVPKDLVGVDLGKLPISIVFTGDTLDDDDDPVQHNIDYALFHPSLNRRFDALAIDRTNGRTFIAHLEIKDAALRIVNVEPCDEQTFKANEEKGFLDGQRIRQDRIAEYIIIYAA